MVRVRHAVGALVTKNNRVLLVRKVAMMDGGGGPEKIDPIWDFPKGGVREGDADKEGAVLRELSEEIGSHDVAVVEALPDFSFDFTPDVAEKIGYDTQITKMYLVSFEGDEESLVAQDEEIDMIAFFTKQDALEKVTFENSRTYIAEHFHVVSER